MRKIYFSILFIFVALEMLAQPAFQTMSTEEYIEKYKDIAIKEMLQEGIPASITLAQGILETSSGNSALAMFANNHFGIKCHKEWSGNTFTTDDDAANECFRRYENAEQSFEDRSEFLKSRNWYNHLFELKSCDYTSWAIGLKASGYATHPNYAKLLIDIIEENNLFQYDCISPMQSITPKANKQAKFMNVELDIPHLTMSCNNSKYIYVKEGETLQMISKLFSISVNKLIAFNDLNADGTIKSGDIIYLEAKQTKANDDFHIVKKGETLQQISQHYGIQLKSILENNNVSSNAEIHAGQRLYLNYKKDLAHR